MGLDHNGHECLHHVTKFDPVTDEEYCDECGDVVDFSNEEDDADITV